MVKAWQPHYQKTKEVILGKSHKMIAECIQNQLEEDNASDQMTLKEYRDPFTGSKSK